MKQISLNLDYSTPTTSPSYRQLPQWPFPDPTFRVPLPPVWAPVPCLFVLGLSLPLWFCSDTNFFSLSYGDLDPETDAYTEGHDGDADDLGLGDDLDMDSSNDFEDYDIDHAEVLLRKEEVEAFA
jgi:hypothetical protein